MIRVLARPAQSLLAAAGLLALAACGGQESEPVAVDTTTAHSVDEIADHDEAGDCWVMIDGGVYDVTGWIPQHPGGVARIEPLCGGEATSEFLGEHSASPTAQETLARYQVGVVE